MKYLEVIERSIHNESTTRLLEANRTAFNRAFFVPEIRGYYPRFHTMNLIRIIAVGLIERNTRPLIGNKFSRLRAVVETRPPVIVSDGQILTKLLGAFTMAIQSLSLTLIGQSWFIRVRKHTESHTHLFSQHGTPMAFDDAGSAFAFAVSLKSQGGIA